MKQILRQLCGALTVTLLAWGAAQAADSAPVVLFDEGHGQRFVIEEEKGLHLSGLAAQIRARGGTVRSSRGSLGPQTLAGVNALVISGPFQPLTSAEIETILRFLEEGGRLVLMLHIGQPFAPLLERLDLDFSNYPLFERQGIIGEDQRNFRVTKLEKNELFTGLESFSVYGAWALDSTGSQSTIIAWSSADAYVDLNGDGHLSRGDVVGSFGVAAAGSRGKGKFLVFGDDAIFQNRFLDKDNSHLARRLASWLTGTP